ncbi:hypothetical protein N0V90_007064 [Kalmusia sp. IMI 367209]|nr:hypothetical protein N0V90_007064 [Kalmusia sp. IMI 367209]
MKIRVFSFVALLSKLTYGLEVAPNSPCAKKCLDDPKNGNPGWTNASLTFGPDLACLDSDYVGENATKVGKKLADCQTCLQSSGWEDSDSGERDTTWFLFNNRGAADWCIFGRFAEEENKNISSTQPYKQCFSACNPIYAASDYRIKSDPERYDYCDSNGNYTSDAQNCMKCLYDGQGLTILGNIVATLTQLCNTKPGKDIGFDEDVYNTTRIKLSTPSSSTSPSPVFTGGGDSGSDSGLSKGAIAGIVLGGLVVIIAVLAGILLFLRRLKKRNKVIEMPHNGATGATSYPNSSYQYSPVQEQKYGHQAQPTGPLSELGAAGREVPAELGPTSPRNEASELGTGSPIRGR